jgi:hypothetical protein
MKTTRILLITALITLGSTLFGQEHQYAYINVNQIEINNRFENLFNGFLALKERTTRMDYHEPAVHIFYIVNHADVVYEEDHGTESWMTTPFAVSVTEEELGLESWMSTPFSCNVYEGDIAVQRWMTSPWI